MGAGASISKYATDTLTAEQAKELTGEKYWDEATYNAAKNESGEVTKAKFLECAKKAGFVVVPATGALTDVMVLSGPVVGKVDSNSAIILLEVDEATSVSAILKSSCGHEVRATRDFPAGEARAFAIKGLKPNTTYTYSFEGLAPSQLSEIASLDTTIKTFPEKIETVRLIALSCDRPDRLLKGERNPWEKINTSDSCDVMLHLGDQVYTKMHNFLQRAEMKMDLYHHPSASDAGKKKMICQAEEELRGAYRYVWNLPSTRAVLAKSSHLMLWSDNDVANDFTEKEKKDGSQYYSEEFIQAGMGVFTEYQRQLWDPSCEGRLPHQIDPQKVDERMKEWHFHRYGPLGVFMVDMRGNRITSGGIMKKGNLMSEEQIDALKNALANEDITCMVIASEIPFVSNEAAAVREEAKKIKFLEGHWAYDEEGTSALFDMCFEWKAAKEGRDIVLIGGDVHIGYTTELTHKETNATIRAVCASPITNHVTPFYNPPEGDYGKYHFKHTPHLNMRNYCVLQASFDEAGKCKLDVNLELIETKGGDGHE